VTRNALEASRCAGVRHYVALSVLGCDRLPESAYMRAKVVQEDLIRRARMPFTIVRSTQFMERLARVTGPSRAGAVVRVPDAQVQPIAAVEAAGLVAGVATAAPLRGVMEIAGPEPLAFVDAVARVLTHGSRVVADPRARYLDAPVSDGVLLPGTAARIARMRLDDWVRERGDRSPAAA
jgi:uncharacterized protein YbjT (DUF2867 family)